MKPTVITSATLVLLSLCVLSVISDVVVDKNHAPPSDSINKALGMMPDNKIQSNMTSTFDPLSTAPPFKIVFSAPSDTILRVTFDNPPSSMTVIGWRLPNEQSPKLVVMCGLIADSLTCMDVNRPDKNEPTKFELNEPSILTNTTFDSKTGVFELPLYNEIFPINAKDPMLIAWGRTAYTDTKKPEWQFVTLPVPTPGHDSTIGGSSVNTPSKPSSFTTVLYNNQSNITSSFDPPSTPPPFKIVFSAPSAILRVTFDNALSMKTAIGWRLPDEQSPKLVVMCGLITDRLTCMDLNRPDKDTPTKFEQNKPSILTTATLNANTGVFELLLSNAIFPINAKDPMLIAWGRTADTDTNKPDWQFVTVPVPTPGHDSTIGGSSVDPPPKPSSFDPPNTLPPFKIVFSAPSDTILKVTFDNVLSSMTSIGWRLPGEQYPKLVVICGSFTNPLSCLDLTCSDKDKLSQCAANKPSILTSNAFNGDYGAFQLRLDNKIFPINAKYSMHITWARTEATDTKKPDTNPDWRYITVLVPTPGHESTIGEGISETTKISLIIGLVIGALVILVLAFWLVKKSRAKRLNYEKV